MVLPPTSSTTLFCLYFLAVLSLLSTLLCTFSCWQCCHGDGKNQTGTSTFNNTWGCTDFHLFFWQISLSLVSRYPLLSHLLDFFFFLNLLVPFSASDLLSSLPLSFRLIFPVFIDWRDSRPVFEYHFWCVKIFFFYSKSFGCIFNIFNKHWNTCCEQIEIENP